MLNRQFTFLVVSLCCRVTKIMTLKRHQTMPTPQRKSEPTLVSATPNRHPLFPEKIVKSGPVASVAVILFCVNVWFLMTRKHFEVSSFALWFLISCNIILVDVSSHGSRADWY